jgi:hypothetical protein
MNKLSVKRERHFSAHHMHLGAAYMTLVDSGDKKPGYFYHQLICITFSALAVEAICNAFGERYIEDWKDYESSKPLAKLRILCNHFTIEYARGDEPWSTAIWLMGLRNKIAHAKPQFVTESYIIHRDEYDTDSKEHPKSKLEKEITLGRAEKAYKCANDIKEKLCECIPITDRHGLRSDGWQGLAEPINDD